MATSSLSAPLRSLFKVCVLLSLVGGVPTAHALDLCIADAVNLQSTLSLGQFQTESLRIRLVQGLYAMPADISLAMSTQTSIEGGFNAGCSTQVVDPANTIIDMGQHAFQLEQDEGSPIAEIRLEAVTLRNSTHFNLFVGQYVPVTANDEGQIVLRNVRLSQIGALNNESAPVGLGGYGGPLIMENVLLDHLATSGNCAVTINGLGGGSARFNHVTADLANGDDFCFLNNVDASHHTIYNGILSDSTGGQTRFRSIVYGASSPDSSFHFANTMMLAPQVQGIVQIEAALSQSPRWIDPTAGNYRLNTNPLSTGINSGSFIPPGGEPTLDIEGHPRIQGSFPDRGAYESSYNDQSTMIVTNTNDSGSGSLRQAILEANSSPAIAKQIAFDIRGANQIPTCPAVIALNSALPAIAAAIAVDGYTQPLSHRNTDANAFNAATCVIVKPVSGSLPVGFRVGADAPDGVAFNLRGVGLGGFAQPVLIQGGSNHVIAGNQFGGTALGVNLPGATINAIAIGVNAGGSVIVGGPGLSDRNVIIDADFAGINIQSQVQSTPDRCQVVNNLIGLKPDGHTPSANNVGVNIAGSGCGLFNNRIAGNTVANVWLQGGSAGNVLQKNLIGVAADGQGVANSATGVLVSGANNLIGSPGMNGVGSGNTIRFNSAGGVVVVGSAAASGNTINGNIAYDNGVNGMDIDLQSTGTASGPSPNDPGDADSGANGMQNFPVAKQLVYTAAGSANRPATVSGVLDSKPGIYRIDAFFSEKTSPIGKRGHAQTPLARVSITVPANGRGAFTLPIVVPSQIAAGAISFTATDADGNTSEVGTALLTDTLFTDGFD